jgi:hypothetical protein
MIIIIRKQLTSKQHVHSYWYLTCLYIRFLCVIIQNVSCPFVQRRQRFHQLFLSETENKRNTSRISLCCTCFIIVDLFFEDFYFSSFVMHHLPSIKKIRTRKRKKQNKTKTKHGEYVRMKHKRKQIVHVRHVHQQKHNREHRLQWSKRQTSSNEDDQQ